MRNVECSACGCGGAVLLRVKSLGKAARRERYRCGHCSREFWVKAETETSKEAKP
jgi:transposase-like protein